MKKQTWFEEYVGNNEKRSYGVLEVLYKNRSEYHEIEIYKLANQGITLVLDGKARVFEVDEYIYHEGITYPALSRHLNAKSILVIGDGDGGIIRELLKREKLLRIDWIEIDKKVIEASECYLPSFPVHFRNDKRVNLIIADALKYMAECNTQYDIIYLSVTAEGDSIHSDPLHEKNTYELIKKVLRSDGLAALSLEEFSPSSSSKYHKRIQTAKQWFNFVNPFYVGLPSFGSNWGFALCCDIKREHVGELHIDKLRFYCKDEDTYMFHIPKYFK